MDGRQPDFNVVGRENFGMGRQRGRRSREVSQVAMDEGDSLDLINSAECLGLCESHLMDDAGTQTG